MSRIFVFGFSYVFALLLQGCQQLPEKNKAIIVSENGNKKFYGTIGKDTVYAYTLKNNQGLKAVVTNYGATLLELWTPDRSGNPGNVILGYDSLSGYLQKGNPYFGAIVGRYANRINHAQFSLDGKTYTLAGNDRGNTLHGGLKGFDKVIWTVNQVNDSSLSLTYSSPNGEEGFPGNLTVKVVYKVNAANGLEIDYTALTEQKTPVNLTNHAYFNLSAGKDSNILNEELTIYAKLFTPVNDSLIPTGALAPVSNTPMDFLTAKKIGSRLDKVKGGYDHNYVLDKKNPSFEVAAVVFDPGSGRKMEVWTTQPGIQFYTGNFLNGHLTGHDGKKIIQHGAFCLETQHFPDSPNQPGFPNTILEPGQTFHERTVYRFSTINK
ncbi:MAG TPA: aldose epimerase family protein [Puia sp.]